MAIYPAKPATPNQDKRWKLVDATMRRTGQQSRSLIETLHTVQEAFGYLDEDALRYVAKSLRVPLSRAYGVATFYHFFTLKPAGRHTCVDLYLGTACYIKGGQQLLDDGPARARDCDRRRPRLTARFLSDQRRCIGSCGLAPAVVYDEEVAGKVDSPVTSRAPGRVGHAMTPEELEQIAKTEREAQAGVR